MFLSSFIFDKKEYDAEFYRLDGEIEAFTQRLPGYIGMESFTDAASGRVINNYYWQDRASMDQLITDTRHRTAKMLSEKWIAGFQVVIAQIEGAHNMNMAHPLAERPLRYQPDKNA
ncbi:hypothetical protein TUM12370_29480 [Salmonella enterica subsp. enterica serovar Choleraesuis]|nr:hypothetical protein TUM12370_29480 [Salmonella enterica subsp. enterica serovar Choleraesuis]